MAKFYSLTRAGRKQLEEELEKPGCAFRPRSTWSSRRPDKRTLDKLRLRLRSLVLRGSVERDLED